MDYRRENIWTQITHIGKIKLNTSNIIQNIRVIKQNPYMKLLLANIFLFKVDFRVQVEYVHLAPQTIEVASVINLLEASGRIAAGLFMTEG